MSGVDAGSLKVVDSLGTSDDLTISTDASDVWITDAVNNLNAPGFVGDGTQTVGVPLSARKSNAIVVGAGAGDDSIALASTFVHRLC